MGSNTMKKNLHHLNTNHGFNMPYVNPKDIKDVNEKSAPEQRNKMIAGGLAVGAFGLLLKFLIKLI